MRRLMIVLFLVVGAIATVTLNVVRSKMLVEERALQTAAVQYSTLRRMYEHQANSHQP
jgi:F0F1-type ATP synthase assembly protein I